MKRFVKNILGMSNEGNTYDLIINAVNKIWKDFDTDRSGKLNKRESLKFINAFLAAQGKPTATNIEFNRFFKDFDTNGDGFISKPEMARFVKLFLIPKEDHIGELVNDIFDKYDDNQSGALNRKET